MDTCLSFIPFLDRDSLRVEFTPWIILSDINDGGEYDVASCDSNV